MRHLFVLALALSAMLGAFAQGGAYKLSDAQIAIRVNDPVGTLKSFAPLVNMVRSFFYTPGTAGGPPAANGPSPADYILNEAIPQLCSFPGVDSKGDFWLIVPSLGLDQQAPPSVYILAPVKDAVLAASTADTLALIGTPFPVHGQVCGNYLVLAFGVGTRLPKWNNVVNDLLLDDARPIVVVEKSFPLPSLQGQAVKAEETQSANNLRQLDLALIAYVQDNNETLPPTMDVSKLGPTLKLPAAICLVPGTQTFYLGNMNLAGKSLGDPTLLVKGNDPTSTVTFYEPTTWTDGERAVAFLDGHVELVGAAQWRKLATANNLPPLPPTPPIGGDVDPTAPGMGKIAMIAPLYSYAQTIEQQEAHTEMGLAMVDNSLSIEERVIPVDGSDLAKGLVATKPDTTAIKLAALLPADMAFVGASGPQTAGIPSPVDPLMQSLKALLANIPVPADKADSVTAVLTSTTRLLDQMQNGGAFGITATPTDRDGDPAVVGIFKVSNAADTQSAVHDFARDFKALAANVPGMGQLIDLEITPGAETVRDVPVDVLKLTVRQPTQDPINNRVDVGRPAFEDVFSQEFRVAYDGDKMLFTFGKNGQSEMAQLINREKDGTPGFTASDRFKALKGNAFPEAPQSLVYLAPTDLARSIAAILPDLGDNKNEAAQIQGIISALPLERTAVWGYGEIQDGTVRAEMRVPLDQLDLFYTVGKVFMVRSQAIPPTIQRPQAPPPVRGGGGGGAGAPARTQTLVGTIVSHPDIEGGIWTLKLDTGDEYVLAGPALEKLLATPDIEGKQARLTGTIITGPGAAQFGKGTFSITSFQILG